jgi:hypothetical protein
MIWSTKVKMCAKHIRLWSAHSPPDFPVCTIGSIGINLRKHYIRVNRHWTLLTWIPLAAWFESRPGRQLLYPRSFDALLRHNLQRLPETGLPRLSSTVPVFSASGYVNATRDNLLAVPLSYKYTGNRKLRSSCTVGGLIFILRDNVFVRLSVHQYCRI